MIVYPRHGEQWQTLKDGRFTSWGLNIVPAWKKLTQSFIAK